jgi:hypothetical protein
MTKVRLIILNVFLHLIHHQHAFVLLSSWRGSQRKAMEVFLEKPKMEFWLDLRGTKLSPQDIQQQLEQEFGDCFATDSKLRSLVTRFLVSRGAHSDSSLPANTIFVNDDDHLMSNTLDGIVMSLHTSGMVADPLSVIDTVAQGRWVIIQSLEQTSPPPDSLLHLVSLVSSVATQGAGVAWPCRTPSDVWEACRYVMLDPLSSISPGGILLPTQDTQSENALQWALILPWDRKLWESAVTLMRDESFGDIS